MKKVCVRCSSKHNDVFSARSHKKILPIFFISFIMMVLISVSSLASLNVALSDQGTGVRSKATGQLLSGASLTIEVWDAAEGGNRVYQQNFANAINNGSWNVMLGETVALPLEYGKKYYRNYSINGEQVSFINGTGDTVTRQFFVSPLGDIATSDIADYAITNAKLIPSINLSNATGYLYSNLEGTPASDQWDISTSAYLVNDSGILDVNETILNDTILAFGYLTNGSSVTFSSINVTGVSYLGDVMIESENITVDTLKAMDQDIAVEGSLDVGGNVTGDYGLFNYGFFTWLGNAANRITSIFAVNIDVSGNISADGNISANYFVGNGSMLTNVAAESIADNTVDSDTIVNGSVQDVDMAGMNWTKLIDVPTGFADDVDNNTEYTADENYIVLNDSDNKFSLNETVLDNRIESYNYLQNGTSVEFSTLNVTGASYLNDVIVDSDYIRVNDILSKDGNVTINNTIYVTDEGNVGIGDSDPEDKLVVAGDADVFQDLTVGRDVNVTGTVYAKNYSANSDIVFFNQGDGAELVRITEDGKVGINTTTPSAALQVDGKALFNNSDSSLEVGQLSDGANYYPSLIPDDSTGNHVMFLEGIMGIFDSAPRLYLVDSDNKNITLIGYDNYEFGIAPYNLFGAKSRLDAYNFYVSDQPGSSKITFHISLPEVVVNQESMNTSFRVESDNDENAFVVNATSGNVGIGLSNPSMPLHVIGGANISGPLYANALFTGAIMNSGNMTVVGNLNVTGSAYLNAEMNITGNMTVSGYLKLGDMPVAAPCTAGEAGRIYYNTTNNVFYGCNSTHWSRLG